MKQWLFIMLTLTLFVQGKFLAQNQIDSPKSILGYEIGERFTRHDELLDYFENLKSYFPENMVLTTYGKTYENRRLIYLVIGSRENIKNLKSIQKNHMTGGEESVNIVWLSYNVHGNESSGSEAAMQTAFDLLSEKNAHLLSNTLVIMDPCMNPDGRERYVNFYYQYGSKPHSLNRNSIEHDETWPGGRPNHYWFDLNRDWAWMTQIESLARLSVFNDWLPHVHVDFHEQGIDDPYYFPPASEPYHEVVTDWQRDFQKEIGKNHSKYFDEKGWLYFSKEIFDLLYPSYGDTYPMFSGAIGMTYEQGGSHRGGLSVINNKGDTLSLKDRIDHHVCAGISTVETASKNSNRLIKEFKSFNKVERFKYKSFVINGIPQRVRRLLELLDKNKIQFQKASEKRVIKAFDYNLQKTINYKLTDQDFIVSVDQQKGALIEALFEPKTKLSDSLTYDISAWTISYAYGINCMASEELLQSKEVASPSSSKNHIELPDSYGYIINYNSMSSALFLAQALKEDFRIHYNSKKFEISGRQFDEGSLIILSSENQFSNFKTRLNFLIEKYNLDYSTLSSGFVDIGVDMGSSSIQVCQKAKVALLVGEHFSSLNVGESWHFFEQELNYPIELIWDKEGITNLSDYNTIIYSEAEKRSLNHTELLEWVREGGHLVVIGNAAEYFTYENFGVNKKELDMEAEKNVKYKDLERNHISQMLIGAIYNTKLDSSNPLCYGLNIYNTLRLSADAFTIDNPAIQIEEKNDVLNGFVGYKVASLQKESSVAGFVDHGNGSIIFLFDNPLFRGFWEQGKLLFANAIFMH